MDSDVVPSTPAVQAAKFARPESLHWLFYRHDKAVSCDLYLFGPGKSAVEVVYLWDGGPRIVQHFSQPLEAVRRHAQMAGFLRECGWLVGGRTLPTLAV